MGVLSGLVIKAKVYRIEPLLRMAGGAEVLFEV